MVFTQQFLKPGFIYTHPVDQWLPATALETTYNEHVATRTLERTGFQAINILVTKFPKDLLLVCKQCCATQNSG